MSKRAIFGGATTGIAPFSAGETNAGMADRGPLGLGCSLPALDVTGHRHYVVLVSLRLGHAVEFGERTWCPSIFRRVPSRIGALPPDDTIVHLSARALLPQFRQRGFDPRENRGLSELRKNALCLSEMLNRERALFLGLVKQAEDHFHAADMMSFGIKMGIF
jgi:hypothetical protein